MKVLENELRGKTVMSEEGLYLGILRNSLVEENTGKLLNILVEPSRASLCNGIKGHTLNSIFSLFYFYVTELTFLPY